MFPLGKFAPSFYISFPFCSSTSLFLTDASPDSIVAPPPTTTSPISSRHFSPLYTQIDDQNSPLSQTLSFPFPNSAHSHSPPGNPHNRLHLCFKKIASDNPHNCLHLRRIRVLLTLIESRKRDIVAIVRHQGGNHWVSENAGHQFIFPSG